MMFFMDLALFIEHKRKDFPSCSVYLEVPMVQLNSGLSASNDVLQRTEFMTREFGHSRQMNTCHSFIPVARTGKSFSLT